MFYAVQGNGEPITPPDEPVELLFMQPEEAVASGRMAQPEIVALARALAAAR